MRVVARFAFVLLAAVTACSSTNLTNLWIDSEATSPVVDNVLVIALERDPEMRKFWEDALSAELQAQGILGRPSYQLFPTSLPDSQQVVVVMTRDNHDAALVAHRLTVITSSEPDGGYRENAPAAHGNYWRRSYTVAYTDAGQPRTNQGDKEARFQLDLARGDGRLVWTGTTTPVDPTDAEKLRAEVAGQVVPELQKRKIIPKE
jgi:hypothetical protein